MIFPTQRRDPELYPYRHGLSFAFFNALNWQVAIGTPTVLFMQQLGANPLQVGLVFSWTFLLTPAQVFSTTLLPRFGYRRLTTAGWRARSLCLMLPILLAVLAPEKPVPWMIHAMMVATFVYSLIRAVGTSAITTWLYQLVPPSIRGRYWATDQMTAGIAIVGSLLLYAFLFAVLPPFQAFIILYLIAVLGALMAYRQLQQLPDVPPPAAISLGRVLRETPRLILRPSVFRTYLALSAVLFAAITPISPFAAYYLKASAGIGTAQVILLTMLVYFGLIAANAYMRTHLDRVGTKPFFGFSYLIHGVIAAGWMVFLASGGRWMAMLPPLYFLQGVGSGCWNSANLSYLAKILPEQDRVLPVSIHGAVITFVGGCTPVLWGLFLKVPGPVPAVNVAAFEVFFGTLLLLSLVLLFTLNRLPEGTHPAGPIYQGSWVWRPFRAVATLVNLAEPEAAGRRKADVPDQRDR